MICPSCSFDIIGEAKFCPECGTVLVRQSTCLNCGAEVSESDKFCRECGHHLVTIDERAPDVPPLVRQLEKEKKPNQKTIVDHIFDDFDHNGLLSPVSDEEARAIADQAACGNPKAECLIALYYQRGLANLPKDTAQALSWLQRSANHGNSFAQYILGDWYLKGTIVAQDDAKAAHWFEMAAAQRNPIAMHSLGCLIDDGKFVTKEYDTAAEMLVIAFDLLRLGADQGFARYQNVIGVCYLNGWGVLKNEVEAWKWIHKAAEKGYESAQCNLGVMYANGRGVPKDEAAAVEWYAKAASQGYALAQCNLGVMYANGRGVPKDETVAVEWYTKAAQQGDAGARCNLGVMYGYGRGVPKDEAVAVEWYTKAAQQNNDRAQYNLGVMYAYGRGVPKDEAVAVEWYTKAAQQGHARAQNNLGAMYANGCGVPKDEATAVEWYKKAAQQGHARAQYNLGVMYEFGKGVSLDFEKAVEWYEVSASNDFMSAVEALEKLMVRIENSIKRTYDSIQELYNDKVEEWFNGIGCYSDGFYTDDLLRSSTVSASPRALTEDELNAVLAGLSMEQVDYEEFGDAVYMWNLLFLNEDFTLGYFHKSHGEWKQEKGDEQREAHHNRVRRILNQASNDPGIAKQKIDMLLDRCISAKKALSEGIINKSEYCAVLLDCLNSLEDVALDRDKNEQE